MPMGKLDADTIKKINSYSEDKSNTEIWKELWLHRSTVWKYRKDIADTLKDKLSKWDKKKLQLLEHYTDKDIQEMLNYIAQNTKKEVNEVLSEPWHLKFALLSDTHFGAKQCAKDELWEFYDRAKEKWVEAFVHCGDIVDGSDVYKGQQFEQSEVWFSNQLQDITQNYPNVWIPTYFIWWNHDEAYLKGNGVNICKAIETVRQDLINLWFYDARLRLNWIDINLHHWGGSLSYAKDYKMKKYLDSLPVEWQPDIFALWHYHTALYDLHRGIHGFMPWAFLKENLLAKRFNLDNTIWGWVIEIDKNEKGQSKLNMEFIKL
jgi:predicted phosphodiesterase